MKKIYLSLASFVLLLAAASSSLADTIRLKDGSVIHGRVIAFKDRQFTILISGGGNGTRSRAMIYVEDIESIEFDNSGGNVAISANDESAPPVQSSQPSRPAASDNNDSSPPSMQPTSGTKPTFFTLPEVTVKGDNTNNGWTSTGYVVRKGQRIRIRATGRVFLRSDVWTTPAGISTLRDDKKLMPTEATGALIGVIGDDNDDFIFIGTRNEFVAQRDGVLFLGVNEGDLKDNSGSFQVLIEAEAGGGGPR
jgi:hypothetical protein